MGGHDPYKTFARRYDAFGPRLPSRTKFFETLFAKHGVKRILDCARGTGTDLLLFQSMGVDVVGSDASDAMLDVARERVAAAGANASLHCMDFRCLPERIDETFDAVVCLSTSLPHVHEDSEILKALRSMRGVLREGGILVLDQGMTDRQWSEQPRFVPAVNTPELSRLMAIDYGEETFTVHVLDFAEVREGRAFHHDTFVYRRLLADDYVRLLGQAGFGSISAFGGFDFEPYSKTESRRLIVVAER